MKKLSSLRFVLALSVFFLLSFTTTVAQDYPGIRDSIYSDILKEKRAIQVVLPKNYKSESPEKYEVMYVLDGEWNVQFMANTQQFTQDEAFMPPIILVAIFNTDRNRDFLPTHSQDI